MVKHLKGGEKLSDFGNLAENAKAQANHAVDFEMPLYNVWKQQEKTRGCFLA